MSINKIAPLSKNQIDYLKKTNSSWLNVAEGGKRGGKNVLNVLAFCIELETHPDKLFLIAGVSIATAKLNIADCDGFGITNFFSGRCREGKYKNRDCIFIKTKVGEKIVLISGLGKNGDERNIKGNTYGMVYVTEANECAKTCLKEVFDRTISSSRRKIFFDLNPKAPKHWFYIEILDFHEKKQRTNENYGFNYGHFTLLDNFSLSDEQIQNVINTYDKNSIWYKRDILGKRIQAEGLINQYFADHTEEFVLSEFKEYIMKINVGVDFGGNKSSHAFVATGFSRMFKKVIVVKSARISAQNLTPVDLYNQFGNFINYVYSVYQLPLSVYCDSAEQTLINGIKSYSIKNRLPVQIYNAKKMEINSRIRLVSQLIAQRRLFLLNHLTDSIQEALATEQWTPDEIDDIRLDDGTSDIDSCDAFEYSVEPEFKLLIQS